MGMSTSLIFKLSIMLTEYLDVVLGSKTIEEEHLLPIQATPRLFKEEITELYEKAKKTLALWVFPDTSPSAKMIY